MDLGHIHLCEDAMVHHITGNKVDVSLLYRTKGLCRDSLRQEMSVGRHVQ